MADSFALSDFVKEKLTSSPEWTNPLGEAAEQIRSGSTTYLYFDDADIVRSSKAREVLLDLVVQCPSTKFVFPVQLFFTRGEGDPSFKDLSAELNIFVDTDLSSRIVSKTSQPNFEDQKARVVGFLREIVAISGSKKVSIVSTEEIEATSNSDLGPTCVLKKGIPDKNTGKSEKAIQISLKLKDADDRSVQRLKKCLELWDYKPGFLVNGALSSALDRSVIPTIGAESENERDRHGLNGYCPADIMSHLSGATIGSIGTLPEIDLSQFPFPLPSLRIVYTGRGEEQPEEDPIDTASLGEDEETDQNNDLVGSSNSGASHGSRKK
jgi:hypothetical protein